MAKKAKKATEATPAALATSTDVIKALRAKYDSRAHGFLEQVNNGVGWKGGKAYADAIVVSLWPSRGIEAWGFEVKVSRSDWRRELAKPEKADEIQRYCHQWWVVSANDAVPKEEVPRNWGLLELRGTTKLIVRKAAPRLKAQKLDLEFVAALLRRGIDQLDNAKRLEFTRGLKEGEKRGPETHRADVANLQTQLNRFTQSVTEFEETSGIKLDQFNGGYIGPAVYKVLELQNRRHRESGPEMLDRAARWLQTQSEIAATAAKELRANDKQLTKALTQIDEAAE